jgi:hypothetical protein
MGYLIDIGVAVPIGVLYTVIVQKVGEILTKDIKYDERIQKNLIMAFIGGMFGYIVAMSLFDKGSLLENRGVKYGMFFGSSLLIVNAVLFNWSALDNDTKLFILGFIMSAIIIISYRLNTTTNKSSKKLKL